MRTPDHHTNMCLLNISFKTMAINMAVRTCAHSTTRVLAKLENDGWARSFDLQRMVQFIPKVISGIEDYWNSNTLTLVNHVIGPCISSSQDSVHRHSIQLCDYKCVWWSGFHIKPFSVVFSREVYCSTINTIYIIISGYLQHTHNIMLTITKPTSFHMLSLIYMSTEYVCIYYKEPAVPFKGSAGWWYHCCGSIH